MITIVYSLLTKRVHSRIVDLFLSGGRRGNRDAMKFLGPIIQERIDCINKYGDDWSDKPVSVHIISLVVSDINTT